MTTKIAKYFAFKCEKGLKDRISKLGYKINEKEYSDRLAYEVGVIVKMNYPGYFLVVADFISWAKKNNILVGDGRGSGAGSLAAFALGITNVDPIKYDLYFERFLNPDRVSMPDFDIDFQKDRRDEVIQYVKDKYGKDKVAQIGTFGTFKAKAAIKGVARTLNIPLQKANDLCKLYPKPVHGKEVKFKEAFEKVEELGHLRTSNSDEGKILRWAEQIETRVASFGIHASGVVIANEALTKTVPLAKGKKDEVVTQWDMNTIDEVGLIKFDFLGLKTLTTIQVALQNIKTNHNVVIDYYTIPLDDADTYTALRRGDTLAVFQLEASSGIRDLTVKVRPNNIEDIAAINSIYRPGPLASSGLPSYLLWRQGGDPTYHHPDLEPILKATGGFLIFQEQALRIARDMAGYTLGQADLLRRAIGKKKEKEMAAQKEGFFAGFQKKGYTTELAQKVWDEIVSFSDYGFNASHAVAYSMISYKTSYLKTHYPVEFMAAALTCDQGNQDQMIIYIQECKRMGIPVLPPDVNESLLDFTPSNGTIRFGLSAIKNVGAAANHIIAEREARGAFKDLFEFAQRVDLGIVNKKKLESLVMSGAFDFTHQNRATLITAVDLIIAYKQDLEKYKSKLETYEKKLAACEQRDQDIKAGKLSDKNKPLKALKAPEKPDAPKQPEYISTQEYSRRDLLVYEKELTGSFISGHPLDGIERKGIYTIQKLKEASGSENADRPESVALLGIISDIELKETKTKQRMAFLNLEDLSGTIEAVIFPKIYNKYIEMVMKNVPLLIHANIEYVDIESDDSESGYITIPSLKIQSMDIVGSSATVFHETIVDVPLQLPNIIALKKAIDKAGSGEHNIRLRFITESDTIISPSNLIGVPNEREFRTEIYRNAKR